MKNRLKFTTFVLLLLSASFAAHAQSNSSGRLEGTWDAVVKPRVCADNSVITSFQAAYYFEPGGNFSGLSSGTGSGGRGREQLGIWKHGEGNQYRFKIKTYLFDAAGVATSYQIVTHDALLDIDGLSWSSSGISKTYSLAHVEINAGCSTIEARRIDTPE